MAFSELKGTYVVVVFLVKKKKPLSLFLPVLGSFQQALLSGGWKGLLLWQAVGMFKKGKGGTVLFFSMFWIVCFHARQSLVELSSNRVGTAAMQSTVLIDSDPSPARVSPRRCVLLSLSLKNQGTKIDQGKLTRFVWNLVLSVVVVFPLGDVKKSGSVRGNVPLVQCRSTGKINHKGPMGKESRRPSQRRGPIPQCCSAH